MHIDESLLTMRREHMPDSEEARVALARPCSFGTIYEFLHAGDPLPEHYHEPGQGHLTIVATGGIRFKSESREQEFWAPAVIDCPGGEKHSFVALADSTVIVNVRHHG